MTRDAKLARVDALLSDRAGVPWAQVPASLRSRTLAALKAREAARRPAGRLLRMQWAAAAAVVVLSGTGTVLLTRNRPAKPGISVGRMDPSPLFAPAFKMLAVSADESLASEARELMESTNQLTRRVVAQLPFTGGS